MSGSSWRLETASLAPRAEGHLHRAREQARPAVDLRARRDELLEDRRLGAVAELDDRAGDERPVRRPDRPADDDRLGRLHAGGDAQDHAVAPAGTGQLGEPVVLGQGSGSRDERLRPRSVADEVAERLERDAGAAQIGVQGERLDAILAERRRGRPSRHRARKRRAARARRRAIGRTGRRRRGPPSAGRRRSCTAGSTRSAAPRTGRRRRVGRRSARPARRRSAARRAVASNVERELCGRTTSGPDRVTP